MTILRLTLSGTTHDLVFSSFRLSEADELKRLTGWTRQEWVGELFEDHPDAIRFAWLIANQRAGTPLTVSFREIDFDLADFDVEVIPDEPAVAVEGAEGSDLPTGPLAT